MAAGGCLIHRILVAMGCETQGFVVVRRPCGFCFYANSPLIEFRGKATLRIILQGDEITIKIDFIIFYMKQMSQIIEDEYLISKYDHPQDLIIESMNFFFYGLLPKE